MTDVDTISLARGAPSLDIVATDELRRCADRAFVADPAGAFSYGTAAGYAPLRDWIADRHGKDSGQVVVTNGSLQADTMLFDLLLEPGDTVVVEAPSYDRTLSYLHRLQAQVMPISLEPDGLDVEELGRALERGARPKLCHVIPNFQNPAGCTTSLEKRRELLRLAEAYDFLIFEDDPYIELRFEGTDLPTMLSLDASDRVVYASSFSKTVCPGIRVGYLVGPAGTIAAVRSLAQTTYISPNMVAQAIVNEFCRSGALGAAVENARSALRARRDTLVQALRRELPQASFTPPQGGYFLWAELADGVDAEQLARAASARGVAFVKGSDFLLEGGEHSLRLAYSAATCEQIDVAVGRLAQASASLEQSRA